MVKYFESLKSDNEDHKIILDNFVLKNNQIILKSLKDNPDIIENYFKLKGCINYLLIGGIVFSIILITALIIIYFVYFF